MRLYWLFTALFVPVAQELPGASVKMVPPVLNARVIESPVAAIAVG
jgi:hypothetical protein